MSSEKIQQIERAAESRIRDGGYNAFSFRDVAADVGIKSSSVHYHFPTKSDLAARVAHQYTERFMQRLGDPWDAATEPADLLARVVQAFRLAQQQEGQMCLCGALGAASADLPAPVVDETRRFFSRVTDWLEIVYGRTGDAATQSENRGKALRLLALLEGAMLIALTQQDDKLFDIAIAKIPR